MLVRLNGSKSLQQAQHLVESLKPEEWRPFIEQINEHGFGMTITCGVIFWCPNTFGHAVFFHRTKYKISVNFLA